MYSKLPQWKTPANFADVYIKRDSGKGVDRRYIYQLIKKEQEQPGSTDIDVMEVDGTLFVKYRTAPTTSQQRAATEARVGQRKA